MAVAPRMLLVSNEIAVGRTARRLFQGEIVVVSDPFGAIATLERESFDVVLSELHFGHDLPDGLVVLAFARRAQPGALRWLTCGEADDRRAVAALRDGIVHRLIDKPGPPDPFGGP